MNVKTIAARLREVAAALEAQATKRDYDFRDEMVVSFIANAFTNDNALKSL